MSSPAKQGERTSLRRKDMIQIENFQAVVGGAAIVLLAIEQIRLSLEVKRILREMEKSPAAGTEPEDIRNNNLSIARERRGRKHEND